MVDQVGRNDPCSCGSGAKYKRCCLDRDRSRRRDSSSTGAVQSSSGDALQGELTFAVEMPGGVLVRRIPNASPLDPGEEQGLAAEDAVQDAAATWGLPDFVYRPALRPLDSGVRELGDGILIVGELAVVIQVKSRVALTSDVEKERRWIEKQIAAASRQAAGTIRSLRQRPAELLNARGRAVTINGSRHRWLSAVVIDHPDVPEGILLEPDGDTVVLLRRDWEFLFDQLKSTYAATRYMARVAGHPIELGQEPGRYYEKATADANTPPAGLEEALTAGSAGTVSTPLLPLAPAASEDRNLHLLVRSIFEDIALSRLDDVDERDRLEVLAELDRVPVAYRGEVGRFLMDALDQVIRTRSDDTETVWRMRSFRGPAGAAHLAFAAASMLDEAHRWAFSTWVQLRHHELQQITGDTQLTTVGVLLTPRGDGTRPWDTTASAVRGDLELTEEELAMYRRLWPLEAGSRAAAAAKSTV